MRARIAIAGLGGVADRIHLPACRTVPDVEIVGACDIDPERRRKVATKFGLPQTFSSCGEMLEQTRPDVVLIGTPPDSHRELCELSLRAGAHVLCEKPFMPSLADADAVIELARRQNLLLRVNNQYRFMTIYRETFERLERNDWGRLFHIQCWQQMYHPPVKEANWRSQLTQYLLYEFATHALDLICYFYRDTPEAVNIFIPDFRPQFEADVLVSGVLRFPGQRLAVINFNRITMAPEKYLEMRLDCEQASLRLSLGGVARLSLEWSRRVGRPVVKGGLARGGQARAEADGTSVVYAVAKRPEFASATAAHLRLFLEEVRNPQRSLEAALHAREVLRVVFAGYESAATGETAWLKCPPNPFHRAGNSDSVRFHQR